MPKIMVELVKELPGGSFKRRRVLPDRIDHWKKHGWVTRQDQIKTRQSKPVEVKPEPKPTEPEKPKKPATPKT